MTNLLLFLIADEQEGKADVILSFPKVYAVFLIGVLSLTNLSVAAVTNVTSVAQIQGTCTSCRICNVPEGQFPPGWFTLAYPLRIPNANSSFSFCLCISLILSRHMSHSLRVENAALTMLSPRPL